MDYSHKQYLVKRIIECVAEYNNVYAMPAPYRLVSQRFAKTCFRFGGLDRFLRELEVDGTLEVCLLPKGNKTISLARGGRRLVEDSEDK